MKDVMLREISIQRCLTPQGETVENARILILVVALTWFSVIRLRSKPASNKFDEMRRNCRKTCKLCSTVTQNRASNIYSDEAQVMVGNVEEQEFQVWEHNAKVEDYMYNQVYVEEKFATVKKNCVNRHELCTFWARFGQCNLFPDCMKMHCAPACLSCDYLLFETRCTLPHDSPVAVSKRGDLSNIFTRIVANPSLQRLYNPQILSRPTVATQRKKWFQAIRNKLVNSQFWKFRHRWRSRNSSALQPELQAAEGIASQPELQAAEGSDPWLIVLDNFLSEEECQTLQDWANFKMDEPRNNRENELSEATTGALLVRTPSYYWCTDDCSKHPTTKAVQERIQHVLQIPSENFEHFLLVFYEEGKSYEQIQDFLAPQRDQYPGPRILTLFLYLNDVEEGGGTNFPLLNDIVSLRVKESQQILSPKMK